MSVLGTWPVPIWLIFCTVAHKYNASLICAFLLCGAVFLLFWAVSGSFKHFSSMLNAFSALPSSFSYVERLSALPMGFSSILRVYLLYQAFSLMLITFVSFAEHFSSVRSTFLLFRVFFGHTKYFLALPITFSSMLRGVSALPSIFSCAEHFLLLCQAFFGYAGHFWALPSILLLCRTVHGRAEQNTQHSRKNA